MLHVVNSLSHESIPLELAFRLPGEDLDVAVAAWYRAGRSVPDPSPDTEIIPLDADRRASPAALRRLRAAIRRVRPDVVHVHHFPSAQMATLALPVRGSPVLVKTEHNDHRRQPVHQNVSVLPVYARCDAVVSNSQSTSLSFYPWERVLTSAKVTVIHNGVDLARIREAPRSLPSFPPGTFTVVTVGRLVEQKNHERLVRALGRAHLRRPELRLLVVGGGRGETKLRRLVESEGLAGVVRVTGMVDRESVYGQLKAADACIMPSLWEGFCNAAVEAMAVGLPLAVSDLPVFREVLGDVPAFFDPTDEEAVASALVALVDGTRNRPGQRSAVGALDHLSLDVAVRRHAELYHDLVT